MKVMRTAGVLAVGLMLIGCGAQPATQERGQAATSPMEAKRFYQLMREEECPPEPCTFCVTIGTGQVRLGTGDNADFFFNAVEGAPSNLVTVIRSSPLGLINYVSETATIVACFTENGRDIVRVQGAATASNVSTSTQISGTFTLEAAVDAGTTVANPSLSYSFVGTANPAFNLSFNSTTHFVIFTSLIVDTDAPCSPEE